MILPSARYHLPSVGLVNSWINQSLSDFQNFIIPGHTAHDSEIDVLVSAGRIVKGDFLSLL